MIRDFWTPKTNAFGNIANPEKMIRNSRSREHTMKIIPSHYKSLGSAPFAMRRSGGSICEPR